MDPRPLLRALGVALVLVGGAACGGADAQPATPKATPEADDPREKPTEDTPTIDALCNPPTPVLIDGKPAGTSPVTGFKVTPGSHDVTFADELTGNRTMTVVLQPGEGKVVTSDRPPSATQKKPEKGEKPEKGKKGE